MSTPLHPADVARALPAGVGRFMCGDGTELERLVALYAETTDVTHPMAPHIPPLRSREELRRHFAAGRERIGSVDGWAVADVVVHETGDPEVVVLEFRYEITRGTTTSTVPGAFVVRVRDGLIVSSRDYIVPGATSA